MNLQFHSNKKELAKLGILDVYVKRKLKKYYSKNTKQITPKQQTKIINDWKTKNSIKSDSDFHNWLNLYKISIEEWIDLINSDYIWSSWCMEKYKDELSQYFQTKKGHLDLFVYSIIKVKNKELADELYLRIKEKESTFEDITYQFSEENEKYRSGKIGPISINNIEPSIASLIKVGDEKQLWEPKLSNGMWFILRLDNILHQEFNTQLKIKLSLELGEKFLNEKFLEIQTKYN